MKMPTEAQIASACHYFDTIYSAGRQGIAINRDVCIKNMAHVIVNADEIKLVKPQPKIRRTTHG